LRGQRGEDSFDLCRVSATDISKSAFEGAVVTAPEVPALANREPLIDRAERKVQIKAIALMGRFKIGQASFQLPGCDCPEAFHADGVDGAIIVPQVGERNVFNSGQDRPLSVCAETGIWDIPNPISPRPEKLINFGQFVDSPGNRFGWS
jgi:hypothetical protein